MTSNISRIFLLISIILISFSCSSSSDSDNPSDDSSDPNDDDDPIDIPIESAIEFEKHYQTNDSTYRFNSIVQLTDSSYTLAGSVNGTKNVLVKFDKYGNRNWTKVMSNTYTPKGIEKLFLNNNGYIGFRGQDFSNNNSAHIIYFDGNGNVEDEIFFDPNINTSYYDMIRDGDNFLIGGNSEGNISYRMHNTNGNVIWEALQPYNTEAFSISKLTDGGFVSIGGGTYTSNDDFLVKINESGDFVWTKNHRGLKVIAISNNEFIAIINNQNSTPSLKRFDQDGDIVWSKQLENFGSNYTPPSPINLMTYDNGLIVCTYLKINNNLDIIIVDENGNEMNYHTIDNNFGDFTAVSKTIDNGLLITNTSSFKFDLIKLSSEYLFE